MRACAVSRRATTAKSTTKELYWQRTSLLQTQQQSHGEDGVVIWYTSALRFALEVGSRLVVRCSPCCCVLKIKGGIAELVYIPGAFLDARFWTHIPLVTGNWADLYVYLLLPEVLPARQGSRPAFAQDLPNAPLVRRYFPLCGTQKTAAIWSLSRHTLHTMYKQLTTTVLLL